MRIIVITPTRNEERYIGTALACMTRQTLLPVKWIIVNDGSIDSTKEIVENFAKRNDFIELITLNDRGFRMPGQGVIEAFYSGFNLICNLEYDVVAKLDADLDFPPDTLEVISKAFATNRRLGITGGTLYDRVINNSRENLSKNLVPRGFVGGPAKFYRKQCFIDIGGPITRAGWDGVDTIYAKMKGWETGELESLKLIHCRPMGTAAGEGLRKAYIKYGDVSYYMGGYIWYFFLRVLGRSIQGKSLSSGYYMLHGYLRALLNKTQRESCEFRKFLKKQQIKNMKYWFSLLFKKINQKSNRIFADD